MIALATCSAFPELDPDDQLLLEALDGRAIAAVWDDDGVDWDAFELVVVRNTWDYTERPEAFLAWAESLGDRVRNRLEVLRWTIDKRYLAELMLAGLPVVPTQFAAPGEEPPTFDGRPVVVKPSVGAGSRGAARLEDVRTTAEHVERLHAEGRVAMVQPYLERIDEVGETALLYFAGAFSHAIRKGALLGADPRIDPSALFVSEEIEPREPSRPERVVGDRVMAWLGERFGELLYARIDLIPGPDGAPLVLEAELAEPSLFFAHGPGSAEPAGRRDRHCGGMDGLILVDKPAGKTSHDVVAAVRRGLGRRRTGHAGTLDPFATGLLIVLVGRATRVQRYLMALPKAYEAVARFGAVSSTGDPEGEITETGVVPEGPLELPTGRVRQRPPAYSAVKVGGERAYKLARRGEAVELPEREVEVTRFEELWRRGDRAGFAIDCSSGTYVRSLIADLGDAYTEELRRTAIGPFRLEEASDRVVPLAEGLGRFLPVVELEGDLARMATHGRAVPGRADGPVLFVDAAGPIAIAEPRGEAELKPTVGFRPS